MNSYFKSMSRNVNPIFQKEYGISLNFFNLDQMSEDLKIIDNLDIEGLYDITRDALEWSNYLSEIRGLTLMLEGKLKDLELKYRGIEAIMKENAKNVDDPDKEMMNILNKYEINNIVDLSERINKYSKEYKLLRKYNSVLLGKIRYFEAMHFKTRNLLTKAMYEIHFGFNV